MNINKFINDISLRSKLCEIWGRNTCKKKKIPNTPKPTHLIQIKNRPKAPMINKTSKQTKHTSHDKSDETTNLKDMRKTIPTRNIKINETDTQYDETRGATGSRDKRTPTHRYHYTRYGQTTQ